MQKSVAYTLHSEEPSRGPLFLLTNTRTDAASWLQIAYYASFMRFYCTDDATPNLNPMYNQSSSDIREHSNSSVIFDA